MTEMYNYYDYLVHLILTLLGGRLSWLLFNT